MAYERLHWVESETPLSADNMNNIEDGIEELQSQKVDKVSGKALSDNNYTTAEKTKLAGIEAGAEVNVQSDWNQSDSSADDYIQNKPVNATTSVAGLMSASDKSKLDGVQAGAQVNRTYTAVTGKPTAAASPAFGGTVTVSQVAQSTTGQISVTDRVITIPSSDATTSTHGLMSAADKSKLNGIAAGAQVNPGNATTSAAGLMSASDKSKLNGIEAGANNFVLEHTTVTMNLSSSTGISAGNSKTLIFPYLNLDAFTGIEFVNTSNVVVEGLAIVGFMINNSGLAVTVRNVTSSNITLGTGTKAFAKKFS